MSAVPPSKPELSPAAIEEEKLIHGLISRGFVTREEIEDSRASRPANEVGPKELLTHLVKCGFLSSSQARRAFRDLETLIHQQIPGYQLLDKLGQGSMGSVFKARQLSMDRLVAIKVLKPKLATNQEFLDRFIREAHVAARLSSNNIVQAIDVGSAGTINYFVMEFVEGTTIKAELEAGRVFPERQALEITLQIAQALDHAHRRQLIHRDVKPANIILTADGVAKLADLGLARQVEDQELAKAEKGLTIGTPYYIAPELIRGRQDADIRSDLYSLGATLYHMVTGAPPFPGPHVPDVLRAHLTEPLRPPDHVNQSLSGGLGEVAEFLLAKEREQRYQTPADLIADLEGLLRGEPPKMARQRNSLVALEELAKGEVVAGEAGGAIVVVAAAAGPAPFNLAVGLAVALGLSIILNLVLLAVTK